MEPLYTTPASLNFTRPCTLCGGEIVVVNGERRQHLCRIDLDAQRAGKSCSNPQCAQAYAHNGPCA